ncbi:MAG: hypothetical protein PHG66_04265 [Candidatus Colwellbacteria bacterium]|nr:hypothetical protein [Candidatus Colwellbacteria bacterium]
MKPLESALKIIKKLSSIRIAGGLSVDDSAIRYYRAEDGKVHMFSLRIPPGIIEGGKIKNKDMAVAALKDLRAMMGAQGKTLDVVVALSSNVVYSQFFSLPQLDAAGTKEAAELNLQMISPINIAQSYHGYQMIGETAGGVGYEFLGAFSLSSTIDDWIAAIKESGFLPVAIEFQSLSVVRAAGVTGKLSKDTSDLIIDISSEGVDMMVVKNGNLYFDYFYSWKGIQGEDKSISFDKLEQNITAEAGKVMNFSLSRFGSEVRNVIVNADDLSDKIVEAVKRQFTRVKVEKLSISEGRLKSSWVGAFGASLRGSLSRSEDTMISLGPVSAIKEYDQGQIMDMVSLWGKIFIGAMVFLVFIAGAGDLLLRSNRLNIAQQSIRGLSQNELIEFNLLSSQSIDFNRSVALVAEARRGETGISPFLEKLSKLNPDIRFGKISIPSTIQPVTINGTAPSADSVSKFHKALAGLKGISDIQFPLSSLVNSPDGRTSFVMSFKVQDFDMR